MWDNSACLAANSLDFQSVCIVLTQQYFCNKKPEPLYILQCIHSFMEVFLGEQPVFLSLFTYKMLLLGKSMLEWLFQIEKSFVHLDYFHSKRSD